LSKGAARVADAASQRVYQYPGQSYPAPETTPKAVAGFQQTLKHNAQTALTQNRARLDQSQQRFADPDPKNANWAALRKQSKTVSDLDSRMSEASLQLLKVYRKATGDRVSSPLPLLSTETSPEARRQLVVNFYQHQLGPDWPKVAPEMMPWVEKLYGADVFRERLFTKEPALAVLQTWEMETKNTPENNRDLQRRMGDRFETTRASIGKLEKGLQNDKEGMLALKFDSVVQQTISGIKDPTQRKQVVAWIEQQRQAEQQRQREGAIGLATTTVAGIASLWFGFGPLAVVFGAVGMVHGGQMSVDGYQQAGVSLDAVQAGDAGGKQLSSMNPHQARMDFELAAINVGLSLLDAKVSVSAIKQVIASRGAVQALGKLKPQQVEQFAEATKLQQAGKTAEAEKTLQPLGKEVDSQTFAELEKICIEKQAKLQKLQEQRKTQEAQRQLKEGIKKAEARGTLDTLKREKPDDWNWLNADPSGRRKELAFDPDTKLFKVKEAQAALQAEQDGLLDSPLRRAIDEHGRSQGGDYIDAKGKYWDVKEARGGAAKIIDTAAPKQGNPGENVLVDCSGLNAKQQRVLEAEVKSKLPADSAEVRFVPARKP
jgi:hypothetical protein